MAGVVVPTEAFDGVVDGTAATGAAAETQTIDIDGLAIEVQGERRIEHDDAAAVAVPIRSGDGAAQREIRVLRHADDLHGAAPGGRGGIGLHVGGRQRRTGEIQHGIAGAGTGTHELVAPGEAAAGGIGIAGRGFAACAIAVIQAVGGVEVRALHLDDQHQIARRQRRGGAALAAERDRGAAVVVGAGARCPVGVDRAGNGGVAVAARKRADLGVGGADTRHDHCTESEGRERRLAQPCRGTTER
ncbi:MAG: hypothetical protein HOP03_08615 [Lysobacter sp.]|nr:hypothetical protein [Lysobacter sp.]